MWEKIKDVLLTILGLLLIPVILVFSIPGAFAKFAGWVVRNKRGRVDDAGGDYDSAGDSLEKTSETLRSSQDAVERSRSDNEQSLRHNRTVKDILREVRERKQNQDGS